MFQIQKFVDNNWVVVYHQNTLCDAQNYCMFLPEGNYRILNLRNNQIEFVQIDNVCRFWTSNF